MGTHIIIIMLVYILSLTKSGKQNSGPLLLDFPRTMFVQLIYRRSTIVWERCTLGNMVVLRRNRVQGLIPPSFHDCAYAAVLSPAPVFMLLSLAFHQNI